MEVPQKRPNGHVRGKYGSRKSESQQVRVLAKALTGKSQRQIAREEGIDHHTVGRILTDKQYQEIVRVHRQEILDLIPGAIRAFRTALDGVELPDGLAPKPQQIEVMDGDDLKRRMEQAYKKGLAAGLNAVKVATEVLKGTQVLVTKQDLNAKAEDEDLSKLSDEELNARLAESVERILNCHRQG